MEKIEKNFSSRSTQFSTFFYRAREVLSILTESVENLFEKFLYFTTTTKVREGEMIMEKIVLVIIMQTNLKLARTFSEKESD
jgi:hypothetical protein